MYGKAMTDWVEYTDAEYKTCHYRRVGNIMEYTGNGIPKGFKAKGGTGKVCNNRLGERYYAVEIEGWETKTQISDNSDSLRRVAASYDFESKVYDTHNFVESTGSDIKATIPVSGIYTITYKKRFEAGDVIELGDLKSLNIEKE